MTIQQELQFGCPAWNREAAGIPSGASNGVQPSAEALRFKHVDRNTWMSLTNENHVTHNCMYAKT